MFKIYPLVTTLAIGCVLTLTAVAQTTPVTSGWTKPTWLTDLSVGVKESNDNNVLLVSGDGLRPVSSRVTDVALKFGINFAPLLGNQKTVQVLSLTYQPDFVTYENDSEENYDAHRLNAVVKIKSGDFSFSFENAFLYNDGSKFAPLYARDQLAGAAGNQNDKFRNNYAHSVARERRNQIQDRYSLSLQYNQGNFFVRPVSSLTYYDLNTDLHNNGVAPYKGYQNYADRYDVNLGSDFGYKITPTVFATLGYRYGYQSQQQFPLSVTGDQHYSSGSYQRVLLGLEGKPASWLTVKIAAGPDFRDYNAHTAINNRNTTRYYGEAAVSATIDPNQSLTFSYKEWVFVASTGLVPYVDSTYTLVYHINATKELGFDLGAKFLEANYTMGNDLAGSAPSLRDDADYNFSGGFTYAFTPHFSLSASYNHDSGKNELGNLAAIYAPTYREFDHDVVTLGVQYKF